MKPTKRCITSCKKKWKKRNLCHFFLRYTSKRYSTPIYNLLAIYHFCSDTGVRYNSRESRKGSKETWVLHPRVQSRPLFSFVLHSFGSFVPTITSPRFVSRPICPCSQSTHRPSLPLNAHLTTTGDVTGDDNTDKGGLSRVKVLELSWIMQRRAQKSRTPWNLYKEVHISFFLAAIIYSTSQFYNKKK